VHVAAARALAREIHAAGGSLVYGGGSVGVMGEVARTLVALAGPDSVRGIIPKALVGHERRTLGGPSSSTSAEPAPAGALAGAAAEDADEEAGRAGTPDPSVYGRTTVVRDMHTRKQLMARHVLAGGPGSGFVALSGGYGTLEELMEVTTWNQLGIHDRPVVLMNVDGYWDGLLAWVRNAVGAGFISEPNGGILVEARSAEEVLAALKNYVNSEGKFALEWDEVGAET
jgi:hypothetical protein